MPQRGQRRGQEALEIEVVVEIPKGSRNKYEVHHDTGAIWLDRMLFTATLYPADYGFVPNTLAEDGDPLDVLVLLDEPTFQACHIMVRPVGLFRMEDEKGVDSKVLCVPATDPRWSEVVDLSGVPEHLLNEIAHFFDVYKQLEPSTHTDIQGWQDAAAGRAEVVRARKAYEARRPG